MLAERPVWLFSSGLLGTDLFDEEGRDVFEASRPKEFEEPQTLLRPRGDHVFFGAWGTPMRQRSRSASDSFSSCRHRGRPCLPAISVTGLRSTPGPPGSRTSSGRATREWGYRLEGSNLPGHSPAGSKQPTESRSTYRQLASESPTRPISAPACAWAKPLNVGHETVVVREPADLGNPFWGQRRIGVLRPCRRAAVAA